MPTYTCTTRPGLLDETRRAAIARAITHAHSAATGAPTSFAQIVFEERAHRFIGGEPTDAHVMVRGDIRAGRSPATRTGLAEAIARMDAALARAGLKAQMLLQVHDELVFEVPEAEVEDTMAVVRGVMIEAPHPAVQLSVPLQVDAKAAANWDEAH